MNKCGYSASSRLFCSFIPSSEGVGTVSPRGRESTGRGFAQKFPPHKENTSRRKDRHTNEYKKLYMRRRRQRWREQGLNSKGKPYYVPKPKKKTKPKFIWKKDACLELSRKFDGEYVSVFRKAHPGAYCAAKRNGWLSEMPWLKTRPNPYDGNIHVVYAYEFLEYNAVYIGLTISPKDRDASHRTKENSQVFKFAKKHQISIPEMKVIKDRLSIKEAQELEDAEVKKAFSEGRIVLNVAATGIGSGSIGALGANKWSKEKVFEEARKYKRRKEFSLGASVAYGVARKKGWLDEMDWMRKPKKKTVKQLELKLLPHDWTRDELIHLCKQYKSRTELQKGSQSAHNACIKMGLIDELLPSKNQSRPIIATYPDGSIKQFDNAYVASRVLNVCRTNIVQCCKGQKKRIHGYTFTYGELLQIRSA